MRASDRRVRLREGNAGGYRKRRRSASGYPIKQLLIPHSVESYRGTLMRCLIITAAPYFRGWQKTLSCASSRFDAQCSLENELLSVRLRLASSKQQIGSYSNCRDRHRN
jgi:hypothetical protein